MSEHHDPLSDADAQWEDVPAAAADPVAVVMSVRMSEPLARRLRERASKQGQPTSTFIRELLERSMSGIQVQMPWPPTGHQSVTCPNTTYVVWQ